MEIHVTEIPNGSHELRIFEDNHHYGDEIDTVAVLRNLGNGEAELSLAHGHLSNEINIELGLKVYQLGYHTLYFYTRPGTKVTRWAVPVETDSPGWSKWKVNLGDAVTMYLIQLGV